MTGGPKRVVRGGWCLVGFYKVLDHSILGALDAANRLVTEGRTIDGEVLELTAQLR